MRNCPEATTFSCRCATSDQAATPVQRLPSCCYPSWVSSTATIGRACTKPSAYLRANSLRWSVNNRVCLPLLDALTGGEAEKGQQGNCFPFPSAHDAKNMKDKSFHYL